MRPRRSNSAMTTSTRSGRMSASCASSSDMALRHHAVRPHHKRNAGTAAKRSFN